MKTTLRVASLLIAVVMLVLVFASCSSDELSGTYSAEQSGMKVSMKFDGDKITLTMSGLGQSKSQTGTYRIYTEDGKKMIEMTMEDESGEKNTEAVEIEISDDKKSITIQEMTYTKE